MNDYHLGNFVLSLPSIAALGDYFHHPVDLLAASHVAALVGCLPSAHKYNVIPYRGSKRQRTLRYMLSCASLVRLFFKRYEAVIAVSGNIRTATLAAVTASPVRIGFVEARRSRVYTHRVVGELPGIHTGEKYLRILACIEAGENPSSHLKLQAPLSAKEQCDRLLHETADPLAPIIALHPGAGYSFRCWPPARFAAVADTLVEAWGANVFLLGSPIDCELLNKVKQCMEYEEQAVPFMQPIDTLLALLQRADLLISNEGGPTHLAATTDVPIVTILGPTPGDRWRPRRDNDVRVLSGRRCPSCEWNNCREGRRCIMDVKVEDVVAAACELMRFEDFSCVSSRVIGGRPEGQFLYRRNQGEG
jgi:heptosyltransferase-2